jgi:RES domain-containing protein
VLSRVVDLRSDKVRLMAGVSSEDLASNWRCISDEAPSQLLGTRLIGAGYEGAIFPSSIESGAANLVVFVRNVDLGQALRVVGTE